MKKRAMRKNLFRTIKASFGRFAAIVGIIALGSAVFVGLIATKTDMVATGQKFMDEHNMYDLRLLSTYGWTQAEVDAVRQLSGIADAEGCINIDVLAILGEGEKSAVYKLHSIPEQVTTVNLIGGRMPETESECLIDGFGMTDAILGTSFVISPENTEETIENLACQTFTVVGYVSSPLYMDTSRGGTSLGNGNVVGYVYLQPEAFEVDYFTEIAVTMDGDHAIYSEAFNKAMEDMAEQLEPEAILLADNRFLSLKADAEESYQEGLQEYLDGRKELDDAYAELEDAYNKLLDGEKEIEENRQKIEDGFKELEDGQLKLDEEKANLANGWQEFRKAKAEAETQLLDAYAELMSNRQQVQDSLTQIEEGLPQLESGIAQLEDGLAQIENGLRQLVMFLPMKQDQVNVLQSQLDAALQNTNADPATVAELQSKLLTAQVELAGLQAKQQEAVAMQDTYSRQLQDLKEQRQELYANLEMLQAAETEIQNGFAEWESAKQEADTQFAELEAELIAGQQQIEDAQAELDTARIELEDGRTELNDAQKELADGWAEYNKEKAEAEPELKDAEEKLAEAEAELLDARETIDTMEEPQVFILDRNANAGYMALDSNSDILQGISRVFPVFFLLIAALVCITTMTRMVEEERIQIGTLKALGYGNGAIIGKYLAYAGIAGVLGCGLGVLIGSMVFPLILWDAYCLIMHITPDILIVINWPLCLAVVLAYTVVVMFVTWYCCRLSLREVPAGLIRPKAPTSGKKIFLERMFFWKKISFLNKVMLRNVFRYRQRMLMMLIGIGGCTALLLTGFGLKASIVNIVSDQFTNVVTHDMDVYFSESQSIQQQEAFRKEMEEDGSHVFFFYQSSIELDHDGRAKDIYLISAEDGIREFMHFRQDGVDLGMPGAGEAFLSAGVAEILGIKVGDTVYLRDPDLRELTVTVAGIYHNCVYNYAIVTPETLKTQWGSAPGCQMAFVGVPESSDIHEVAAALMGMEGVMNVTVNEDVAEQVTAMLDALDTVVMTIVAFAGALAVIVLYNLTNINITERNREIATIKVLGFRAGETAAYVFKENMLLSVMGIILGIPGGWYLLKFVISQVQIDMVRFLPQLSGQHIALGVALTILAACLVDFLLYFKLEKINMAEALKSVE